jgi:hypothetical protein
MNGGVAYVLEDGKCIVVQEPTVPSELISIKPVPVPFMTKR